MNNFWQRTITGILFVAVIVGSVIWHPVSFLLIFGLISLLCLNEFYSLMKISAFQKWSGIVIGFISWVLAAMVLTGSIPALPWMLLPVPLFFLVFLYELFAVSSNRLAETAYLVLGFFYISMPLLLLAAMGFIKNKYDFTFILAMMIFTWVNDTMAYVTGSLVGSHKFFERISPKKTWEGIAGGILFTLGFAFIMEYFFKSTTTANWVVLALIASCAGIAGDLFESVLKRRLGIKDSGKMFPGHGGLLDRFDALLFVIPFFYLYLSIVVY